MYVLILSGIHSLLCYGYQFNLETIMWSYHVCSYVVFVVLWLTAWVYTIKLVKLYSMKRVQWLWVWIVQQSPMTLKAPKWWPSVSVLTPSRTCNKWSVNWLGSTNHMSMYAPGNIYQNIYSSTLCKSKNQKHCKYLSVVEWINSLRYVHVMIYYKANIQ